MTEEKLIKTKLEIEAKEYEQKQRYKGLLDALYEEGQNKGYECARSYITPYIVRAYIEGARVSEKRITELEKENAEAKELLKRWVELSKPKLEGYPIPPIQEQTEQFLNSEGK